MPAAAASCPAAERRADAAKIGGCTEEEHVPKKLHPRIFQATPHIFGAIAALTIAQIPQKIKESSSDKVRPILARATGKS